MSMRIDGQSQPADAGAARRLESTKTADRPSATGAAKAAGTGDRVEVSSDAQLVANAIRAAEDAANVRPEAVERGRRALESGTLGNDATRLADRLIDSLLGE
jgi:flagellar biosynthesis anti-sigma factor FlgM